ncbi:MAG: DUF4404 family protein [Leptospiraceae bacterium]|nr:DUF4404 family protein [Leptospiraceae bacterium]MCP5498076.1 DUF4404 family protein [Leptospiraceae bacterium]
MLKDTISKMEFIVKEANSVDDNKKKELLGLIGDLKKEIGEVSPIHQENAQSLANFAKASTHEATKINKDPELLQISLNGLSVAVKRFEASHPELVSIVNSICTSLSNSGL